MAKKKDLVADAEEVKHPREDELKKLVALLPFKARRFFHFYGSKEVGLNATKAGELAGYKNGMTLGNRAKQKYPAIAAIREEMWRDSLVLSPFEVEQIAASIARDPNPPSGANVRLKALELVAKIHGMLSEKLDVTLSRKELINSVQLEISKLKGTALAQLPDVADPEVDKKDSDNL